MRKILGCLALAHLAAFIWLGACAPALAATEPGPEGTFKPVEVSTSKASAAPARPEPEERAASRSSRNQGESQGLTTINLPPKTAAAQVDQRAVKKDRKTEKMPPTQSYPPPPAQPAPAADEAQVAPDTDKNYKRARSDKRQVTTITLPKKQEEAQADDRSGRKAKSPEAAPVSPGAQPGQVQAPAPMEGPEKAGRSSKKSRQRADKKSDVQAATPPVTAPTNAPARVTDDQRKKSSRSQDRSRSRKPAPASDPNPAAVAAPSPSPERAGSRSKKQPESRSVAPVPDPNQAPVAAMPAPERAGSRSKKQRESRSVAPVPDPNQVPLAAPERAGSRSPKRREPSRAAAPAPAPVLPTPPGPAVGLSPEQEMTRAYQAFDLAYDSSLGKTRKELNTLWGFPMQKMADNGVEVAYGFRQKGLLNLPEPTGKSPAKQRKAYYASSSIDPSLPGQYFTCLVVLWVDKQGRGVVVDGEAVGDCFIAEALSRQPDHFER